MKKSLIAVVLGLALTACSSQNTNKPVENWKNFETKSAQTEPLKDTHSRVVFYRGNDIKGPAVNVYVDGRYQASVLPNSKTMVDVCANKATFETAFDSKTAFNNSIPTAKAVNYASSLKKYTYIKLAQNPNGQLTFVLMDNDRVANEVAKLPLVKQTSSRVPFKSCYTQAVTAKEVTHSVAKEPKFDPKKAVKNRFPIQPIPAEPTAVPAVAE